MPRVARIIFNNAICHIFNRGNAKQEVFHDEEDFKHFLYILAYFKEKYRFKTYHLCSMPNHFHFLWQISQAKVLSQAMHDVSQTYTKFHHQKYHKVGYLWQGRFKNMIVEKEEYLLKLGAYIERNPVRAGLVKKSEDWRWSSYRFYAFGEPLRVWVKIEGILKPVDLIDEDPLYKNLSQNPIERQKIYREFIESLNDEEIKEEFRLKEKRGRPREN